MNTSILIRQQVTLLALIASFLWALPTAAGGTVLFVDDDAPADGDGLTWDTAYRFLQDALVFAADPGNDVSEIRVAQGVYKPDRDEDNPDGTNERDKTFELVNNLTLAGGYAGFGAGDPDARDVELYETILSGDLLGDDEAGFVNNEENCYHVVTGSTDEDATLDGFTVTAGNGNSAIVPFDRGGGMLLSDGAVFVNSCMFVECTATLGGAVFVEAGATLHASESGFQSSFATEGGGLYALGDVELLGCTVSANTADGNGGGLLALQGQMVINSSLFELNSAAGEGGGMYSADAHVELADATLVGNTCDGVGGGARLGADSDIDACTFTDNTSVFNGAGGMYLADGKHAIQHSMFRGNQADVGSPDDGGALKIAGPAVVSVFDCEFIANVANGGGAIECDGLLTVDESLFEANFADDGVGGAIGVEGEAVLRGTVFLANDSDKSGGAVSTWGQLTIQGCQFTDNIASDGGGAVYAVDAAAVCVDSVFTGNHAGDNGGAVYCRSSDGSTSARIEQCEFVDNSGVGGAISCTEEVDLEIVACHFQAQSGGAVSWIDANPGSSLSCVDSTFISNEGTGLVVTAIPVVIANCVFDKGIDGPGLHLHGSSGAVTGCLFLRNDGGGVVIDDDSDVLLLGCAMIGNQSTDPFFGGAGLFIEVGAPTLVDCVFVGNTHNADPIARGGGGILAFESDLVMLNCTLAGNTTLPSNGIVGGGIHLANSALTLTDSILWGNTDDPNGSSERAQVFADPDSTVQLSYSCVEGLTGNLGGVGNIGADPLFVDLDGPDNFLGTLDDDVRLSAGSPVIDAGDNSATILCQADRDGHHRRFDDPRTTDTGVGDAPIVDMGAYEFGSSGEDCDSNGLEDACELMEGLGVDCNANDLLDACDISSGFSFDCNFNGVPDECDLGEFGQSDDCNRNGIPDECDILYATSSDCNDNGIPDECEPQEDCNGNGVQDICDIADGTSLDCNLNGVPDECDVGEGGESDDCNRNGIPDECESDCNKNGIPDECDIADGTSLDCNVNDIPDECDIAGGESDDVNNNGIPDECEEDCNGNGVPDVCDIDEGVSRDCNLNGVPDECDLATGLESDCNLNGVLDSCEIANGDAEDCNGNGLPDDCDLSEQFRFDSGALSPVDEFNPQMTTIPAPPEALGAVTLSFAASADISFSFENIEVFLNGESLGVIYEGDGNGCGEPPNFDSLSVDPRLFNLLVNGGNATLDFIPNNNVDACAVGSYINLIAKYTRDPESEDDDRNGIPDECILGDIDGDGDVDGIDLLLLLGNWGACPDCVACPYDLDGDCDVDGADLILLLGNWG